MIRVVLAEDQPCCAARRPRCWAGMDIEVAGTAGDGESARREPQRPAGRAGHRHRDARPHRSNCPAHPAPRAAGEGGDRDHLPAAASRWALDAACRATCSRTRRSNSYRRAVPVPRRPRDRPAAGAGSLSEPDPLSDRERQVPRLAGGPVRGPDRRPPQPVPRHGAQLSVRGDRQARRGQPDRGLPAGARKGLAVAPARAIPL